MKHIFLIHNHTLFLTSLGVIEREKISPNDIIFVYSRNYKCDFAPNYNSFDFSKEVEDTFYIMLSWSRRHFFLDKKNRDISVGFFDHFVKENASEGYYLYVCHLQTFASQILATNKLCKNCFYIQEGGRFMASNVSGRVKWFCRLYNKLFLKDERRVWKMTNWFPDESIPYNKPIIAYAFDRNYFANVPKETRMIRWPRIEVNIELDTSRPFFLLEGAAELGQVEMNVYEKAVEKIVDKYAKENNYIKFHPKNSPEAKKKYISFFHTRGKGVEELPMNIPFELILVKYDNLDLYGFGTSLLFYGKALGHRATSCEEYLMSSTRYRTYLKGLQTLDQVLRLDVK